MNYKFLIYVSYSYALPIGNPLEGEILKRGYEVKWFSDLEDGKKALDNKDNVFDKIKDVVNYKPNVVLAATDDVPDFITGLKVQIFHGFFAQKRPEGNEKFAHFRIRGFFDLYCTQGPTSTNGFQKKQKLHPHFEVAETGWSKVDPLFPIEKADSTKPVIMIASTFTKRLSLAYDDDVFNTIKILSQTGEYEFKMVLHPKLPEELKQKWQTLNNDNFTYYNTTDLIPLFKQSHILFADTTSAIQEYLLQLKPVVTFRHTFDHNYLINIKKSQHIEDAFKKALSQPKDLLDNVVNFVSELHPFYDGKSSARVIDACITQIQKDKSHLKNKPLNIIRKYKMRKRLGFFTLKSFNKPYSIKR